MAWGTYKQNMEDRAKHGRHKPHKGEDSGLAKLTKEEVDSIRTEYTTGRVTQRELAAKYKVCQQHVSGIINKVFWA